MMTDGSLPQTQQDLASALARLGANGRYQLNPDSVTQDLTRLVLGLVAFLRQLMELQAIRQMEQGLLNPEQEERLGTTLMQSEIALHQIAAQFGLEPADLSLDLGPLGRTI